MKKLLMVILACGLCSCASSGPGKGVEAPKTEHKYSVKPTGTPVWDKMEDISSLFGNKAKITGKTVDMQGGRIDGSSLKRYSNSQDERNTPIKTRIPDLTIKNGYFYNIPGGVVTYAENTTFENITLTKIGEDGISNAKDISAGTQIIDCKFYNTEKGDKSLQLNDAREAIVKGNLIAGGITGIRLQESSAKKQGGKPRVEGNTFKNVDTGINAAGKTTVYLKNNKFEGVRENYKTSYDTVKFVEN